MDQAIENKERLHGLDAVRTIALLLGIVLHASMSYMPGLQAAGYPLSDVSQSEFAGIIFYVIHIFRMATFFLIAGFFARLLVRKRGVAAFLRNRRARILYVLLFFWLPVLICIIGAFGVALEMRGIDAATAPQPEPAHEALLPLPLAHLWFLYVLLWLYGLSLFMRWLFNLLPNAGTLKARIDAILNWIVRTRFAPLVLAVPIALLFPLLDNWRWWAGVATPDYSLDPHPVPLGVYLVFFLFGWALDRQHSLLAYIKRHWWINVLLAAAMIAVCLSIVGWESTNIGNVAHPEQESVYGFCYALAMTTSTFALIGIGLTFLSHNSSVLRYLADGSYWIYVWHLPLMYIISLSLMDLPWHWGTKISLLISLTFIVLVLTYNWVVRSTFIGKLMNGRKYPRGLPVG